MSDESSSYADWDQERRDRYDAERERIQSALSALLSICYEDEHAGDPPYLQGWVAVTEWTNVELEQNNQGGRHTFTPHGQMFSIGAGLAAYAVQALT